MKKKNSQLVARAHNALGQMDKQSEADLRSLITDLTTAAQEGDPWWVIALKTLAYLIGLLLAGMGTTAAAQTLLTIV